MPVAFTGSSNDVVNAINGFDTQYHLDYVAVMTLRSSYLSTVSPSVASVTALATGVDRVLRNWGAGLRKAPSPKSVAQIAGAIAQPSVMADLRLLLSNGIGTLSVTNGTRRAAAGTANVPKLDATLIRVLNTLSTDVFMNNTNVTYPMKALLLLTGYMPAFDSQVRKGLQRGGFVGMDQTRMLMPSSIVNAANRKITRLPYWLGDCWNSHPVIRQGAAQSNYPWLQNDPGRLFDVLLFMQANTRYPVLLQWRGDPQCAWYDLP